MTVEPRVETSRDDLRKPPAFLEYASDLLALESVQLMSLAELGLLWTMRLRCWVNGSLPKDKAQLSRLLGRNEQEVCNALTPAVMAFFKIDPDDSCRLICPELAAHMRKLMDRRIRQSEGGRAGGISRREKVKAGVANPLAKPLSKPSGKPMASEMKRNEMKRAESSGGGFPTLADEVEEMRAAFGETSSSALGPGAGPHAGPSAGPACEECAEGNAHRRMPGTKALVCDSCWQRAKEAAQ